MRQARRLLNFLPDKALDKMFNIAKKLNIEELPLMNNLDFQLNLVKPLAKKAFSWKVISLLSSF
ncbi:MAG: hypothetical protein QXE30_05740 [Candidatus Bathyarchaeia archaeon]